MGNREIARYEQFLLFPQCFQKACFQGASKGVIVWEWVNSTQSRLQRKANPLEYCDRTGRNSIRYELRRMRAIIWFVVVSSFDLNFTLLNLLSVLMKDLIKRLSGPLTSRN